MNSSLYLDRYAYGSSLIEDPPPADLELVIVIPCYFEPELIQTLQSLAICTPTTKAVEVIVIVNQSENSAEDIKAFNLETLASAQRWVAAQNQGPKIHLVMQTLPAKHAGVGLARKLGMDEAVRRFHAMGEDGIIACLDADCTVSKNYLVGLVRHFQLNPDSPGCSIYYEHALDGSGPAENYRAIAAYELHLRYYTHALKSCGLPCAFQTVGSAMAVRSSAYQKQGGMNKRKAGEDFYFLQKIMKLGNFTELNRVVVFPSPRPSTRVPFGTGKAILDLLQQDQQAWLTYHPSTFEDLKQLASSVDQLFRASYIEAAKLWESCSTGFQGYIPKETFIDRIVQFNQKTGNTDSFRKRFFQWCDGFFAFKYANYARDHHYPPVPITEAASYLLKNSYGLKVPSQQTKHLLMQFRALDKRSQPMD